MNCPYCKEFRGNNRVKGYTVKDQLRRHIEIEHCDKIERAGNMDEGNVDDRRNIKRL